MGSPEVAVPTVSESDSAVAVLFSYRNTTRRITVSRMESAPSWMPVKLAAPLLGLSEQGLRKRIRAGTVEVREEREGNRKRVLVRVERPVVPQEGERTTTTDVRVALLEERVALLEQERDRLAELLRESLRARESRAWRWPGLWPALQRFWRGEG